MGLVLFTFACTEERGTRPPPGDDHTDSGRVQNEIPTSPEEDTPVSPRVWIGAAGDFGGRDEFAGSVMADMADRELSAFFLLGDMSYSQIVPEEAWCDWVHASLGSDYPFEVIAGNHEEDSRADGHIRRFADCMPDRLNSDLGPGGYSVNFSSDVGPVTFIATSPNLTIDDVDYTYGSGTPERDWLVATIEQAHQEGDWVVVGMHKNCVTIGSKRCEIGAGFAQLLIEHRVDLVLQGHDHDYQRSHSLATVVENGVGMIADDGADARYARGVGTVIVIVGTAGKYPARCGHDDPEYGNFATHWCAEEAVDTKGYLLLSANSDRLTAEFVTTAGTPFHDAFTID